MAVLSSLFWVLGLLISVAIAPQLRIWTWGPGMLCFAVAAAASASCLWDEKRNRWDTMILVLGFALFGWIGIRAFLTPAYEASRSDLLLLSMAAATFLSMRAAMNSKSAQRIIVFGLTAILAANIGIIGMQIIDPAYSPIFPNEEARLPGGFFAHYSYGAAFLIPGSLILAGFALFSKENVASRILFALVALAGAIAVYFTKSRGGFVGIGAGVAVLLICSLLVGGRDKRRWFAPAVIIVPVMLIVLSILFFSWLSQVEEARGGTGSITGMLDNSIRLYLIGIAFSCIGIHPLHGGGSRSFSWECFQFWDTAVMSWGKAKPEHVHNELLQTATDYGLIGVSILLLFVVSACLVAGLRLALGKSTVGNGSSDAWRVGGLAAFAGLLAQSNFEGIFRIPPGAIMLGLCIAALCIPNPSTTENPPRVRLASLLLAALAIGLAVPLSVFGWKGSRLSYILWPSYFSHTPSGLEPKADAVARAVSIWPLPSLYQDRAKANQTLAASEPAGSARTDLLRSALSDFQSSAKLHPFDPETAIGAASILSALGRNSEAEAEFRRAIELQGEMEPTFYARGLYARHLCRKGISELKESDPSLALGTFQLALVQTDWIAKTLGYYISSDGNLRTPTMIRQGLGMSYERLGDFKAALAEYDLAATLPNGTSSHYLAGMLYGKRAVNAWSQRESSDALRLFIEAEARINQASENPEAVTQEAREEYSAYLRKSIEYLQGAKVEPSATINF
jgi:O-antigen ligase/tetratricopeptide (TPR) repeat protein